MLTQQVVVGVGTTGKNNSRGQIWRKYRMLANWNYSELIFSVVNPDPVSVGSGFHGVPGSVSESGRRANMTQKHRKKCWTLFLRTESTVSWKEKNFSFIFFL